MPAEREAHLFTAEKKHHLTSSASVLSYILLIKIEAIEAFTKAFFAMQQSVRARVVGVVRAMYRR